VRRQWLIRSPFDEVLDPHGIGDNYGVAFGFPSKIHVLNSAWVLSSPRSGKPFTKITAIL
jgi:hypothetical protein